MGNSGKVLIVDDEPSLLKMMSVYLARKGYDVATAGTTEKAWVDFEAAPGTYSVVVLDATMKGIPMNELAERMLRASGTLRVLTASGYPVDMSALAAIAPGRVEFLHKPFSPEMLAAAVRRMLGPQEENV
jgi:two-component system cell cycle sensor histidine kinase/response regulator CckA